jgi:hypothetical protein
VWTRSSAVAALHPRSSIAIAHAKGMRKCLLFMARLLFHNIVE